MVRNFVVRLVFWLVVVVVFLPLLLLLYSPLRHVLNLPMNNINELRHRRWWWRGEGKGSTADTDEEGRRPVQSIETSLWMLIANRIPLRQWDGCKTICGVSGALLGLVRRDVLGISKGGSVLDGGWMASWNWTRVAVSAPVGSELIYWNSPVPLVLAVLLYAI